MSNAKANRTQIHPLSQSKTLGLNDNSEKLRKRLYHEFSACLSTEYSQSMLTQNQGFTLLKRIENFGVRESQSKPKKGGQFGFMDPAKSDSSEGNKKWHNW